MTRRTSLLSTLAGLLGLSLVGIETSCAQDLLDNRSESLTTYRPNAGTPIQGARPIVLQRGVNIDGTERADTAFDWAVAANPFPEAWNANDRFADIQLITGAYSPLALDLSIHADGIPWVVGRTYNARQQDGNGSCSNDSYQGWNWFQTSQPELIFVNSEVDSSDMIVLMYGGDRFLEFYRVMSESTPTSTFRGVNGAAGAIVFAADSSGPDTYTYYDQHGTQVAFFGFDSQSGVAQGQLWKMTDPMGHVTYVGDATTKSTAISNGYDSAGRVLKAYDASGNRYSYTYSAVDSLTRLTQVKAERQISSTWTEVGRVDYAYYHASGDPDNDHGLSGDLKLVTVTTPLSDTSKSIQKKTYYRYYGRSSFDGNPQSQTYHPGYAHQIKMVIHPEGLRRFDWGEDGNSGTKTLDDSFLSKTDATLNPYAMAYFTYEQTTHRVASAWFNGECACSGGSAGVYKFRYEVNSSYTDTSGYQNIWSQRVVVLPPVYFTGTDVQRKTVVTQYFDEVGQSLSRVESDGDTHDTVNDDEAYREYWPKLVDRDATTGAVVSEHPPKNIQSYSQGSGSGELVARGSLGLARKYVRVSSGQLKGLLSGRSWSEGTGGTPVKEWEASYTTASLAVSGDYTMIRPLVSWKRTYPDENGTTSNQTDFTYSMHSGSAALMPKSIQTQAPVVSTTNNGAGGTTRDTSIQYLRADGTLAFSLTPDGIYNYQAVSRNRVTKVVRDISTSSSEIASGDTPGNWGLSSFTGVFALKTTYTYDEQGRLTDTVLPSTRTQRLYYAKLDDERGVTFSIARVPSSATAFGPVGYTVFNSQNRPEAEAGIALPSEQTTVALGSWIVSNPSSPVDDPILALSSSVGSIQRLTTHAYNKPGTREVEKRVYSNVPTQISSAGVEDYGSTTYEYDVLGRMYRVRYPGYDTLGRSDGVTDPRRTFVRTIFNPRGMPVDRIIGTVDSDDNNFVEPNGRSPGEIIWCGSGHEGAGGQTVTSVDGGGTGEGDDPAGSWCCGKLFVCEGASGEIGCCAEESGSRPWNRAYYDFRGRLIVLIRQDRPSVLYKRDNLGRVIAVGLYSSLTDAVAVDSGRFQFEIAPSTYDPLNLNTSSSRRLALMTYSYDEQDRNWKQTKYAVEPPESSTAGEISTTDASKRFESVSWFDASDRVVKSRGDSLVKYKYDRLGRLTHEFFLSRDNDSGYTDASSVSGDTVLRERQSAYEASTGNVLMTIGIDRFHNDNASQSSPTTTALDLNSDSDLMIVAASDIKGRVSIQARWYDTLDRVRTIVDFGTSGGLTFNRTSTSEPTASTSTALVWTYSYNTIGGLQDVKDANGRIVRTFYDHAGQVTSRIENYVDGTPGPSDQDRVTQFVYTHGLLAKYIVKVPNASDQVTEYYYGTSLTSSSFGNGLATGHLLWKIKYPDSSGSTDLVTLEYNRTGKVIRTTDQAGNMVRFGYDSAKRLRLKEVTAASGFVDDIYKEEYFYNAQGLLSAARQSSSPSTVSNESTFLYDAWWNLNTVRQDVDSAVDAGSGLGSYDTSFSYEKVGSSNTRQAIRRTGITYPDSYQVDFDYLVSTGSGNDPTSEVANDVSRVYRVKAGPSGVPVAKYDYIGIDGLVGVEYPETTITSARYGSTYGTYPSLDQFDRLVSDTWVKGGATSPNVLSAVLSYDASSNVKSVTDGILAGQDALFTLDNLDRLTRAQEGTLSSGSITSPKRDEQWTLSQPGNWAEHKLDKNGDSSYTGLGDIQETAQFNNANEFNGTSSRSITTGTGGSTSTQSLSPTFDAVGNLTGDGKDYVFKYDALGRLRKVYKHSAPTQLVAEFGYNALDHLISAKYDTDNDGSMSDEITERYVYDNSWRIIAIYVTNAAGTTTTLHERYIRYHAGIDGLDGSSYIDAIVLRDRNANTSSSDLEERRYYCQNWHGDVSAITDEGGNVIERVKYSAYGVPRVYPVVNPDIDDGSGAGTPDGGVTIDDLLLYLAWFEDGDIRADVDDGSSTGIQDGGVTIDDLLMYQDAFNRGELPAERLSGGTGNRFGYGGYLWDAHFNLNHIRYRCLLSELGKFMSRDMLDYATGGTSLYEYAFSIPQSYVDPSGLIPMDCPWWPQPDPSPGWDPQDRQHNPNVTLHSQDDLRFYRTGPEFSSWSNLCAAIKNEKSGRPEGGCLTVSCHGNNRDGPYTIPSEGQPKDLLGPPEQLPDDLVEQMQRFDSIVLWCCYQDTDYAQRMANRLERTVYTHHPTWSVIPTPWGVFLVPPGYPEVINPSVDPRYPGVPFNPGDTPPRRQWPDSHPYGPWPW